MYFLSRHFLSNIQKAYEESSCSPFVPCSFVGSSGRRKSTTLPERRSCHRSVAVVLKNTQAAQVNRIFFLGGKLFDMPMPRMLWQSMLSMLQYV